MCFYTNCIALASLALLYSYAAEPYSIGAHMQPQPRELKGALPLPEAGHPHVQPQPQPQPPAIALAGGPAIALAGGHIEPTG